MENRGTGRDRWHGGGVRPIVPLTLDRVSRTVGAGDRDDARARARVTALTSVEHPGICAPLEVVREDDAVVVRSRRVPGVALDHAERVGTLGEWTWLVAELAAALAALHAAGLAHGDVSPGNVIVGFRPVLIDLVGPALGRERGTASVAAPERAAGGPPDPASDVYALGASCLAVAGDDIRAVAQAWMAPLMDPDPARRPRAAAVAHGIRRCATPRRWNPGDDPAAAAAGARTETDPRAWRWRLIRRPWRAAAVVAIVAAVTAAGLWGPEAPGSPWSRPGDAAAAPISAPPAADAAAALTRARVSALARGDAAGLTSLAVPGTSAWSALAREARLLADLSFDGLHVVIGEATVVDRSPDRAVVDLDYSLSAHTRRDGAGMGVDVPAEHQRARLTLAWDGVRWRVEAVEPSPLSGTT